MSSQNSENTDIRPGDETPDHLHVARLHVRDPNSFTASIFREAFGCDVEFDEHGDAVVLLGEEPETDEDGADEDEVDEL